MRTSSRGEDELKTRPGSRGSSRGEVYDRGGRFVPVLATGPSAAVDDTTATVSWTLDTAEPAGYHQLRYRLEDAEEWTTLDFTGSADWSASIDVEDLDPGIYEFQARSCARGDGTLAFDFATDPADTFEIESGFTLEISNVEFTIGKEGFVLEYDTNADTECLVQILEEGAFPPLYQNIDVGEGYHSEHEHQIEDLDQETYYRVRIKVTDEESNIDWSPSESGYYRIRTADSDDDGGGVYEIVT